MHKLFKVYIENVLYSCNAPEDNVSGRNISGWKYMTLCFHGYYSCKNVRVCILYLLNLNIIIECNLIFVH
jgi:hypothetical protein